MNPLSDEGDRNRSSQSRLDTLVSGVPLFVVKLVGLVDQHGDRSDSRSRFDLLPAIIIDAQVVNGVLCSIAESIDRRIRVSVARRSVGNARERCQDILETMKPGHLVPEVIERGGILVGVCSRQVTMQVDVSRPVEAEFVDEVPRRRNRVVAQPPGSGSNRSGQPKTVVAQ